MDAHLARPAHGQSAKAPTTHRPQHPPSHNHSLAHPQHQDNAVDADSAYSAFAEPPNKLRKTKAHIDKSKGLGTTISITEAALHSNILLHDDIITLPHPEHPTRTEPPQLLPIRSATRELLKAGSARPGIPTCPRDAPRHAKGLCDYFPWTRKHPEDVLTETTTRQGYSEKALSSSAETTSARPSIIACIRNKATCDSLSDLIVASFQRRQQICSVSSRNTFKPPPRVTLTDNKRELWLRDLADGAIPLRRLSRTIPHGIRGKILLDHCLAKQVPTWRAIWLVKCVGSNEIRAFRRKGATSQSFGGGGELKWLKEWTDGVLNFVDSLAKNFGSDKAEAREHVDYALSLVSQVYHEQLIDKESFNQSITARLTACPIADGGRLCLWLSVARRHLVDILENCPRGCELVKCLLSKLHEADNSKVSEVKSDVVSQKCRQILENALCSQPASFIIPGLWPRWNEAIRTLIPKDDSPLLQVYDDLGRRNAFLNPCAIARQSRCAENASELDVFDINPDPEAFLETCQRLAALGSASVRTIIDWCTSPLRMGLPSIYLAARVIRLMSKKHKYSCQDDLAELLASADPSERTRVRRLHMLAAELVRSQHFSVSKYLHFLLSRGMSSLSKQQLAILTFVPRQALSTEVMNLANSLCSYLEISVISSKDEVEFQVSAMQLAISKCRPSNGLAEKDHSHVAALSTGTRSAIARQLRNDIHTKRAEQSYPSPDEHDSMDIDCNSLQSRLPATLVAFELLQDFPTLADVLLLFAQTADCQSLIVLALCVKHHHRSFQAMSALQPLFSEILKRYAILYQDGTRDRDLTRCMGDVAKLIPDAKQTALVLQSHFDAISSEAATVACSPVSDQMLDVLQSREVQSLADLDHVLQSGSVINEALMSKMLKYLMDTLESSQQDLEQMSKSLRLLRRLAESDKANFSTFLARYLHAILSSKDAVQSRGTLQFIIAGELCPVDGLISNCLRMAGDPNKKMLSIRIAASLLVGLASPPTVELRNCVQEYYMFCSLQRELMENKRASLQRLTKVALQNMIPSAASVGSETERSLITSTLDDLVASLLRDHTESEDNSEMADFLSQLNKNGAPVEEMLCRIIKLDLENMPAPAAAEGRQIAMLRGMASAEASENATACLLLTQIAVNQMQKTSGTEEILQEATAILLAQDSVWQATGLWAELVSGFTPDFVEILHQRAFNTVLEHTNSLLDQSRKLAAADINATWEWVHSLLFVLGATSQIVPPSVLSSSFDSICGLMENIANTVAQVGSDSDRDPHNTLAESIDKGLDVSLQLSINCIPQSQFDSLTQDQLVHLTTTMCRLYIDLTACSMLKTSTSTAFLDFLLHLVCHETEETRSACLVQIQNLDSNIPLELRSVIGFTEWRDPLGEFVIEVADDSSAFTSPVGTPSSVPSKVNKPLQMDPWEMLQDTVPTASSNDACLNLSLFGARQAIL